MKIKSIEFIVKEIPKKYSDITTAVSSNSSILMKWCEKIVWYLKIDR